MSMPALDRYLTEVRVAIDRVCLDELRRVGDCLMELWRRGGVVYAVGNGGSAALASHLACDLGKNTAADLGRGARVRGGRRLRVVGLSDNGALLTALANDLDFAEVYVEQLKPVLTDNDVVLAVSGSGTSDNVLRALRYARTVGATTVAFTGARATSAPMLDLADYALRAPAELMEQIEDFHVIFNHALAVSLRERIAESSGT
ncbi:SIS domain-containing protein [Allokutzneria sp. A3M-2-11 16]|uniref:SIS domain-containing protein n=1 Tax=Allokutzneria sp. A3M-2-11 16 TaxID=2962043 RepID=UPI0020B6C10C|nr:SIS domain-containing protein [Allokutzneria sp. A3M-2-11 16]MCP3803236.1 SIS domain-containing protein [Allokutzneria sp. A3M-2-11 16]